MLPSCHATAMLKPYKLAYVLAIAEIVIRLKKTIRGQELVLRHIKVA